MTYEQDFLNLSYGFRPERTCHDALKALNRSIEYGRTSYIVDADIRSFFTKVNHEWLMKFLEERTKILEFGHFAEENRKQQKDQSFSQPI